MESEGPSLCSRDPATGYHQPDAFF